MYKQSFELMQKSTNIVLLSHIDPDADALGSALGLYSILKNMKKNVNVVNYSKELAKNLDFLPNFEKVKNELPNKIDLIIICDTGNIDRVGFELPEVDILNIDHHKSNTNYGTINLIEPNAPSTSAVIYNLLMQNNVNIDKDSAICLYTALVEDTGFFKYESTNEETFEIAKNLTIFGANPHYVAKMLTERDSLAKLRLIALVLNTLDLALDARVAKIILTQDMLKQSGAKRADSENIANMVRAIATVEVSIFLKEENEGIKVSLRSKNYVDVSEIAMNFGGGGHQRASGFSYNSKDFEALYKEILSKLKGVI